ncbi:MAG: hypothetical protein IJQ50_00090 [Clostridia bacterium]|nr:hypothetical protein [Clostridia bacterium]
MSDNTKKVIILDNIKGTNIQQAIFVLKDKKEAMAYYDILDEANGIIYQYINQPDNKLSRSVKKKRKLFGK